MPKDESRYALVGALGTGASGRVTRVHDRLHKLDVALKSLPVLEGEQIRQLKEEFRLAADICHPNVVALYELHVARDRAFFSMELVQGTTLVDPLPIPVLEVARQIVMGVHAVHAAGLLHRDIKPANILVTPAGRVVLIDLGLAKRREVQDEGMVGTPLYMAPEQAWGRGDSPATDWYSVGVVLYELTTGALPYTGNPLTLFQEKQVAPSCDAIEPAWLGELIGRMLDPDPEARPAADEILGAFDAEPVAAKVAFVGRDAELTAIVERVATGNGSVTRVLGLSGVGKTALVHSALRSVDAVVLRSRCHPHESVAYKMFDGVVDDLSRHLPLLQSQRLDALKRLFPVLGESTSTDTQDAISVRRQAMEELGRTLGELASTQPVILWMDDLQWADADSVVLLRRLVALRVPGVHVILTARSEDAAGSVLASLEADPLADDELVLQLSPLSLTESRALARSIVPSASDAHLEAIVEEASGSPFALREFAMLASETSRPSTIHEAIRGRMQRLSEPARGLVEILCVATRPVGPSVLLHAGDLGAVGLVGARLEREDLLRRVERGGAPSWAPYHDKIREVVVESLSDERLRVLHGALADGHLTSGNADPEVMLVHSLGADRAAEGARYAMDAGRNAERAFAFGTAAQHFHTAAENSPDQSVVAHAMRLEARALGKAGRGVESGNRYLQLLTTRTLPEVTDPHDLRRKAAEQLIRGGALDRGLALQSEVLADVGVSMPSSPWGALLRSVIRRLWATLTHRGRAEPPLDSEIDEATTRRLDAIWGASTGLSTMNFALADDLGTRHLLETLRRGGRSRTLRAISYEAAFEACIGTAYFCRRARAKLDRAHALLGENGSNYDRAWTHMAEAAARWSFADWGGTVEHGDRAMELYLEGCPGTVWELGITQVFSLSALGLSGRLIEQEERLDLALDDAMERGDLYAANNYRLGQMSIARVLRGRQNEALDLASQAKESWPKTLMHSQWYHYANFKVQAELYRGDASAAWQCVDELWPVLGGLQLLRCEVPGLELRHLRARAALALIAAGLGAPFHKRLVRREMRSMQRHRLPMGRAFGAGLAYGLASLEGSELAPHLQAASTQFRDAGMMLHADAAADVLDGGHRTADRGVVEPSMAHRMWLPARRLF